MSQMQIEQVLAQIRALAPTAPRAPLTGVNRAVSPGAGVNAGSAPDFGSLLKKSVDAVNQTQQRADALATAYERGDRGVDLAKVMLETQKASISFRAMTEVRNRLVNVYQEIMNMPI